MIGIIANLHIFRSILTRLVRHPSQNTLWNNSIHEDINYYSLKLVTCNSYKIAKKKLVYNTEGTEQDTNEGSSIISGYVFKLPLQYKINCMKLDQFGLFVSLNILISCM